MSDEPLSVSQIEAALEYVAANMPDESHVIQLRSARYRELLELALGGIVLREEFVAHFKAHMLSVAGPTFDDGSSIAEYADMTGPTYWDDPKQRKDGPEACADSDMSYWGE